MASTTCFLFGVVSTLSIANLLVLPTYTNSLVPIIATNHKNNQQRSFLLYKTDGSLDDVTKQSGGSSSSSSSSSSTSHNHKEDVSSSSSTITTTTITKARLIPATTTTTTTITTSFKGKKPTITSIKTLQDLNYFLQDDEDRLSVIKFYAPWCKSCKRLEKRLERVALELGDGMDTKGRQKVKGLIRVAQVEYGPSTQKWITELLQIPCVPTLQMYLGTQKVWQELGTSSTANLSQQLQSLLELSLPELKEHAESVDDGIFTQVMEDSFYDIPDFLNEEW